MTYIDIEVDREYQITGLKETAITSKLISMGVIPGSNLSVVRTAPLGGVFFVKIDDMKLAMRRSELEVLELKEKEE